MLIRAHLFKRNPLEEELLERVIVFRSGFEYLFRLDGPGRDCVEGPLLYSAVSEKDIFTMGKEIPAEDIHIFVFLQSG